MAIFSDETSNHRQYLCIRLNDHDDKETKMHIRKPITYYSRPNSTGCPIHLPSWSRENLKTGEIFLLSSHSAASDGTSSYRLLHRDIMARRKSWEKFPLLGEFSYTPLYWEWLEDVLVHCRDLIAAHHLLDAFQASLCIYDKCPNIIRAICEYWCPETNSIHTSQGEVSISIMDIHSFLGLPFSGLLYDEVIPLSKELKAPSGRCCNHLFTAYHILRQRLEHKPTIEEWIAFWFRGRNKYRAPAGLRHKDQVPVPDHVPSATNGDTHKWDDSHAVFDELRIGTGERTETFLAAFISCWLCIFVLPVRDVGYIRPGTFMIASNMARGKGYCLPSAILASIYRGLGEISRSSHPGRRGGHCPWHFLYAWIAKYFRGCSLDNKVSPNQRMVQFGGLKRARLFNVDDARELISSGRGFCWDSSISNRLRETLTDDGRLRRADFAYFASIRSSYLSYRCEDYFVMEHYCPHRFSRQFGFYQDIPADMDSRTLPTSNDMLGLHRTCVQYETGSKVLFPGRSPPPGGKVTCGFQEWWAKVFSASVGVTSSTGDSKRKRGDSEDASGSELGLKKFARSSSPTAEENTPQTKIPGIDVASLAEPISAIPLQSVMPTKDSSEVRFIPESSPAAICRQKLKSIIVCAPHEQDLPHAKGSKLNSDKTTFIPPAGAENIMNILDWDPSPTECMGESGDMHFKEKLAHVPLPSGSRCFPSIEHLSSLGQDFHENRCCLNDSRSVCTPEGDDEVESISKANVSRVPPPLQRPKASQDVSLFNADDVIREVNKSAARMTGQVILDKVFRTPFEKLPSLRGEFDSLYNLISERGGDAATLKNKVERVIEQAHGLKDLRESYSNRLTAAARDTLRAEVNYKLNEASNRLDTETTHYNAIRAQLAQVESRREELLRELQSLDDQKKELNCQVVTSEDSLQEAEREVTNLQGQVDTIDAIEVIDPATIASLEKTEAYVKESFEDLRTFQWTP